MKKLLLDLYLEILMQVEIQPNLSFGYYSLSRLYSHKKDYIKAENYFNKVLKTLNPKQNNLNLILTLAGRIDKKIIETYSNKIDIINKGYIDHNGAISTIKSSHLLINFNYKNTEETDMVSGKLIEYLASGSPIINFSNSAKESEVLLKKSQKSFNANNNNINQVVTFIKSEYFEWLEGRYKKQSLTNINSLSRENLTKKLFDIITRLRD